MTEQEMMAALKELFPQASVTESQASFFWFVEGDEKKMRPFLTVVTTDEHDAASNLSRPGVYRLNFPLRPPQYRERFGSPPRPNAEWSVLDTGQDYTALDVLMPHPIYAPMNWVCILNPSHDGFQQLFPLLGEVYAQATTGQ
ncbi:DUF6194 family protein [Deinococcus fonticola]|uniref:DUF6194 family protein n=1 Tax=Deinococcus fonticola TaxID=2528713 RepID=UPI001431C221|nr:DUF6194 family protein [Deinococcus fonticola]